MRALSALRHVGSGLFSALAELGNARMTPPRDPRDAAHRLAGALGALGRAHDLAVTVRGEIPRGPALIVANYVSYLDPLAILPVCPAVPIVRGEVLAWPVIGPIGAALGVVFVRGDRMRVLRRVHTLLAAGVPVLDFPEGSSGASVQPFHRGTFGIAQRVGVPVVPVAVRYRDPARAWCDATTFLPHYLRTAGQSRIDVELVFGSAMSPRAGELPEDMAARARNAIARALAQRITSSIAANRSR